MRHILTRMQVQRLLDGKDLQYGHKSFVLPEDFENRPVLELYCRNNDFRSRWSIVLDIDVPELAIKEREGKG